MAAFVMYDTVAASVTKTDSGTTNGGTYAFGAASATRIIAAAISVIAAGGNGIGSLTIGGIAATLVARETFTAGDTAEIWAAVVPTGTSGVISGTGTITAFGVTVYAITGASSATPFDTQTTATTSVNLGIPVNGGAISVSTNVQAAGSSFTWTGLTEDTDFAIATSAQSSAASGNFAAAQTLAVTATPSATTAHGIAAASWGP